MFEGARLWLAKDGWQAEAEMVKSVWEKKKEKEEGNKRERRRPRVEVGGKRQKCVHLCSVCALSLSLAPKAADGGFKGGRLFNSQRVLPATYSKVAKQRQPIVVVACRSLAQCLCSCVGWTERERERKKERKMKKLGKLICAKATIGSQSPAAAASLSICSCSSQFALSTSWPNSCFGQKVQLKVGGGGKSSEREKKRSFCAWWHKKQEKRLAYGLWLDQNRMRAPVVFCVYDLHSRKREKAAAQQP